MQEKTTKLDFTNQEIYVGLDIGKNSWKTSIMTEHYEHKTFTQPPRIDALVKYLHRMFPGATYHCVYEAGYQGYWIHEALKEEGIDCIVVNPADVPSKNKEYANKTDRVDARKLARCIRSGELDAIYVPFRQAQENRSLVRTRHQFVKKQTRCKNQIKGLLSFYGITIPDNICTSYWSRRFVCWLEQIKFQQASGDKTLGALLEELKFLRKQITYLTLQIRTLSREEQYCTAVEYLSSIPGIGTLSSMILLTEIIDINRFNSVDRLASFCGIIPGEHSSGNKEIITGISTRRNSMLRKILIECAWVAVRKDPALIMSFNKLSKRMPKNKAIICIARKLLNRINYVLKNQQYYKVGIV